MCGIAGIVSTNQREIGPLLREMLDAMGHRGPDGAGLVVGDVIRRAPALEKLATHGLTGYVALGHVRLAITGGMDGMQPFQSQDRRLSLLHNGEVYNHRELAAKLDPASLTTGSDSEVVLRLLEQEYDGDLEAAVRRLLPRLDGVYALAATDQSQTVLARDPVGVRQLYYYDAPGILAFASERKPLVALGGWDTSIKRLLPGHMLVADRKTHRDVPFHHLDDLRSGDRIRDLKTAMAAYKEVITTAVAKRIQGRPRVGIIYSGGVDSVLIAYLAKSMNVPFTCYTAARGERAADLEWARKTADELGFPLHTTILTQEQIETLIPDIVRDIEDHSMNQVEVAIPIYAAVRAAQEAGERVVLTGQGADELFGGYPWYPIIVQREGHAEFEKRSWEDASLLYQECLEREDKITMAHSLELRVPFLDPAVIALAFSLVPELKIRSGDDTLGKHIHRECALQMGIPHHIAYRVKEAAQHGANVHDAMSDMAQRAGVDSDQLRLAQYDPDRSVPEKLGSSSRYGYRYEREDLWKPRPDVQFYLDAVADRVDVLPPAARDQFRAVRDRLPANRQPEVLNS